MINHPSTPQGDETDCVVAKVEDFRNFPTEGGVRVGRRTFMVGVSVITSLYEELLQAAADLVASTEGSVEKDSSIEKRVARMKEYLASMRGQIPALPKNQPLQLTPILQGDLLAPLEADRVLYEQSLDDRIAASPERRNVKEKLMIFFDEPETVSSEHAAKRIGRALKLVGITGKDIPVMRSQGEVSGPIGFSFLLRAANRVLMPQGMCLHQLPSGKVSCARISQIEMYDDGKHTVPILRLELNPEAAEELKGYKTVYSPEASAVLNFIVEEEDGAPTIITELEVAGFPKLAAVAKKSLNADTSDQVHEIQHKSVHVRYPNASWRVENGNMKSLTTKLKDIFTTRERTLFGGAKDDDNVNFMDVSEASAFGAGMHAAISEKEETLYREIIELIATMYRERNYDVCRWLMNGIFFDGGSPSDEDLPELQAIEKLEECITRGKLSLEQAQIIAETLYTLGEVGAKRLCENHFFENKFDTLVAAPDIITPVHASLEEPECEDRAA